MGPQYLLRLIVLVFLTCLPAQAAAFPSTPILDSFDGCTDTTTPPNANWTNTVVTGATSSTVDCEDQAITSTTGSTEGEIYWNGGDFGPDCEAYGTIVSLTSFVSADVGCRMVNLGASTTDGYAVQAEDAGNTVKIRRFDNGAATTLDSTAQTIAVGDSVGIKIVGDQVCSWYKVAAGSWAQVACVTDATYSAAGKLTVGVSGNGGIGQFDDIGGGTVSLGTMMRKRAFQ